jgi:NAD(P)-dependent dehydrogenase (short-subunit alcohol dehydrogenase family)
MVVLKTSPLPKGRKIIVSVQQRKTIVITGAGSGIGYSMTSQLVALGHRILAVYRTEKAARQLHTQLIRKEPSADIVPLWADLSVQSNVRNLANTIQSKTDSLDVLINNAGCVSSTRILTVDGIELQLAVNHIAPFLLTKLLVPSLAKSPQGRVINVSSRAHARGTVHWNDLMLANDYTLSRAYNQSKLCNLMATFAFAESLKEMNISVNAFHPGLVNTAIGEKHTSMFESFAWKVIKILGKSSERAALTGIMLATNPDLTSTTGQYFSAKGPVDSSVESKKQESINRLVGLTEGLIIPY